MYIANQWTGSSHIGTPALLLIKFRCECRYSILVTPDSKAHTLGTIENNFAAVFRVEADTGLHISTPFKRALAKRLIRFPGPIPDGNRLARCGCSEEGKVSYGEH